MNDINMTNIITLIWIHWFADFILQSDVVAKGKSDSYRLLAWHGVVYMFPFVIAFGWPFAVVSGILHICVDSITSLLTAYIYPRSRHWFFVMIGLDQAIHITLLLIVFATYFT